MNVTFRDVDYSYSSRKRVFEGLSLDITTFPTVLLGPNGAGKSTMLGLISGQIKPRRGVVSTGRISTTSRRNLLKLRRESGWLPQDVRGVSGLTIREQVAYAGWLKKMSYKAAWRQAETTLDQVGLAEKMRESATKLSGGQRRRLGIAQALISDPSLIVLDEPYAGLDPEQRASVRETLLRVAARSSLIVSTHQTEDIEDVYANVIVLSAGKVIYHGATPEFFALAPAGTPDVLKAEMAYRAVVAGVGATVA